MPSGSNIVSSKLCNWENEYISFICGLCIVDGCGLMGERGVWKCMGDVMCVAVVTLPWPSSVGSAGAVT